MRGKLLRLQNDIVWACSIKSAGTQILFFLKKKHSVCIAKQNGIIN